MSACEEDMLKALNRDSCDGGIPSKAAAFGAAPEGALEGEYGGLNAAEGDASGQGDLLRNLGAMLGFPIITELIEEELAYGIASLREKSGAGFDILLTISVEITGGSLPRLWRMPLSLPLRESVSKLALFFKSSCCKSRSCL